MAFLPSYDDISLSSIKSDFQGYRLGWLRSDLLAGFSVALLAIPQVMAYALIAGLPPIYGLYGAIFAAAVAALFGSSRHVVIGPTNVVAFLIAGGIAEVFYTYYRDVDGIHASTIALQVVGQLTLMVGIIQLAGVALRLGSLVQFVSHSVVVGYFTGTAIAVIVNQSFVFLGIPSLFGVESIFDKAQYLVAHGYLTHWPSAVIGVVSITTLLVVRRYAPRLPSVLVMLVVAGSMVYLFGWAQQGSGSPGVLLIRDTGDLGVIAPTFALPFFNWSLISRLLPIAFAISLLGLLETTSLAKSIAVNSGQQLSSNQSMLGLGLANIVAAMTGAMPCSASASRSILNYNSGARSRLAAIFGAGFVAVLVWFLGPIVTYIPLASLAALLLVTACRMVNKTQLLMCLKATRSDYYTCLITMLSCVFFSLDVAFYIGIGLSITLYVRKAAHPAFREYAFSQSGQLRALDPAKEQGYKKVRCINIEGELFFGASDLFQTTLRATAEDSEVRVIILRLKSARDLDATACLALNQLYDYLKKDGRYLLACGIKPHLWEVLCDSGLVEKLGKDNLFVFEERRPGMSMHRALRRANSLIGERPIDKPSPMVIATALLSGRRVSTVTVGRKDIQRLMVPGVSVQNPPVPATDTVSRDPQTLTDPQSPQ